jgi:hypothetical protein
MNPVDLTMPAHLVICATQGLVPLTWELSYVMKKAILAPLCSAFVIPGLGQIINQHLIKGGCILFAVFILFVAGTFTLYHLMSVALNTEMISPGHSSDIMDRLKAADFSALWYFLVPFALIWLYSVLDAYLIGRKLDQTGEGEPP